jgi:hypothetical protein
MTRIFLSASLIVFAAGQTPAQTPLKFEVATLKHATSPATSPATWTIHPVILRCTTCRFDMRLSGLMT